AVVDDRDVADLAGAEAVALEQRAVEDEARPDPPPDLDRDEVLRALALRAKRVLGERGRLAVIRDVGRQAIPLVEEAAERQVLPVQVDGPSDRAGPRVNETRRADTDAEGRRGGFGEELVDEAEDEVERGVTVAAVDRLLDDAPDLAAEVDERARDDALPQVESDDLASVADDAEEDRGLAARRGPATDLLDHALVEQRADDVADGRPGQARAAGDLGATDRP